MTVNTAITPLLIQSAVERTGDDQIPGRYCPYRHVWILEENPIVRSRSSLSEMMTKTEAQLERDDVSDYCLVEMLTKTKVQLERDDQEYAFRLPELVTKTDNTRERDD